MLPSPEQYAEMLDGAAAGGFAFPAVNATSSQTLNAAIRGFAEAGSDGIVQVTVGGARYLSGAAKDALTGARAFAALGREVAARSPVAIALHTDHCPPADVDSFLRPLIADSGERVQRGAGPLFNSHMFDGSTLPLAENLELSTELLRKCRELAIVLEVECGVVGGEEDGLGGSRSPAPLERASAGATCSPRPLGTSTASTRPVTWSCAPGSSRTGSGRSGVITLAPASSTSSTVPAGPRPGSSGRLSTTAS